MSRYLTRDLSILSLLRFVEPEEDDSQEEDDSSWEWEVMEEGEEEGWSLLFEDED